MRFETPFHLASTGRDQESMPSFLVPGRVCNVALQQAFF
jgi:hypothetical protein